MYRDLDHPHVGNPQPYCMCIDCREWRKIHVGDSAAVTTNLGRFNAMRYGRLEGTGFIVLNARDHSFEEFTTLDAAKTEAGIMAGGPMLNGSGCAIIYAPVAVVRPAVQSDVQMAPSGLMQQIQESMRAIASPAPTQERINSTVVEAPPHVRDHPDA